MLVAGAIGRVGARICRLRRPCVLGRRRRADVGAVAADASVQLRIAAEDIDIGWGKEVCLLEAGFGAA